MLIKNWKYQSSYDEIGELSITRGQFMTGNILGIIAEKIPLKPHKRNIADASSYNVPVRIKLVDLNDDLNCKNAEDRIKEALTELEMEGCRAVITTGGRLGCFDHVMHSSELLALSTPLAATGFIITSIPSDKKVGIFNDLSEEENRGLMQSLEYSEEVIQRCVFNPDEDHTDSIAAVVWDKPYGYDSELKLCEKVPVYDIIKLASLISYVVMQKPYQGVI